MLDNGVTDVVLDQGTAIDRTLDGLDHRASAREGPQARPKPLLAPTTRPCVSVQHRDELADESLDARMSRKTGAAPQRMSIRLFCSSPAGGIR
jgi:hypothetical protein